MRSDEEARYQNRVTIHFASEIAWAKQLASAARRVGWLAKGTFTIKGGPRGTIVCTQPNNLLIVFFVIRASWSLKSAGEQQSHRKPRSSENSGARTFLAIVAEGRSAKE